MRKKTNAVVPTALHTYHMWYRTSFGNGHRLFRCRDREHAIGVAKIFAERNPDPYFSLCEGYLAEPFFVKEVLG